MPWSRARIHQLSRDAGFLARLCGGIIAGGVVVAVIQHGLRGTASGEAGEAPVIVERSWSDRAKAQAVRLGRSAAPHPEALAAWLSEVGHRMRRGVAGWSFDAAGWRLAGLELEPLLRRHTMDDAQRALFEDYARGLFLPESTERAAAVRRVREASAREPAPRFAAGFEGDLLQLEGRSREALAAWLREGRLEGAVAARVRAFDLALGLEDEATLRALCGDRRYQEEVGHRRLFRAARILGDRWLMLRAVAWLQWQRWSQTLALPLALLAAGVWYGILVYTGSGESWRWLRQLTPVFAGVMSVWVLHWWQGVQRYGISEEDQVTMTHEILQWILYVGVPEELVKLALFVPFLPILLRRGSRAGAALTAGCVGLGFAFDENLGYYLREGGAVAIGRLITANFLHVALTGIAGAFLYELFRSRFHSATSFLGAFIGVCVAHGFYDFATTDSARELGVEIAGIVILAVSARVFLDQLRPDEGVLRRRTVSSTAVFCVGSALLVAATVVVTVWEMQSLRGVTEALRHVVAMFPVALIYVREFREL